MSNKIGNSEITEEGCFWAGCTCGCVVLVLAITAFFTLLFADDAIASIIEAAAKSTCNCIEQTKGD